eukprot:4088519-Pleurochrysis_carterae.AAC.2
MLHGKPTRLRTRADAFRASVVLRASVVPEASAAMSTDTMAVVAEWLIHSVQEPSAAAFVL